MDVDNAASIRVLERAGFRLEGRVRHDYRGPDGWRDAQQYALLADDPPAGSAARGDNPTPGSPGSRMSGGRAFWHA